MTFQHTVNRLAIITTHPIQYYAPLFKRLADVCLLKVFYTWGEQSLKKYDPGFQQNIEWNIPLLEGYDFEFLQNSSSKPGTHHFNGIINPQGVSRVTNFTPDAILVFGWANHSHLKIMRHFKGKVPVWFRGDSTLLDNVSFIKNICRTIALKLIYRYVDIAFYVGSSNKKYFLKYGFKEQQLTFAPHSVENDRFDVDRSDESAELRKRLRVDVGDILILFAGKFEDKKDPFLLLTAFKALHIKGVHLLFVGSGDLEENLKANTSGSDNIHFLNFHNQRQMPGLYHACDLFCLPSKGPGETWGLAVNEAMAAGKAVLVSDKVGCAFDLVKPGVNGEIFKSGNSTDLLSKLDYLIKSNQLRLLGENSKKIIGNWTLDDTVEGIRSKLNTLN